MKAESIYIDLTANAGQIHASGHYKNGTSALTGLRKIFQVVGIELRLI